MPNAVDRAEPSPIVIIGAGGHGVCIADVAMSMGHPVAGFVDSSDRVPSRVLGLPVSRELDESHLCSGGLVALGVGDNFTRSVLHEKLVERGACDVNFPVLIHKHASVSPLASLGAGTVVFAGATIGPAARIGQMCVLTTNATATHHAVMADYSFLATAAVLGDSSLGTRSFVGMGGAVNRGLVVGEDVVIGAKSLVLRDVADRTVVYGVPARIRRSRQPDEPYLTRRTQTWSGRGPESS